MYFYAHDCTTLEPCQLGTQAHNCQLSEEIILWNNEERSWLGQKYARKEDHFVPIFRIEKELDHLGFSNEKNWTLRSGGQNKVFNINCLKFSSKCLGTNENTYEIKLNKTHSKSLELKAEAQCIFPFKYNGKNYSKCTMDGSDRFWCATSVDSEDYQWTEWGYCTTKFCPTENTSENIPEKSAAITSPNEQNTKNVNSNQENSNLSVPTWVIIICVALALTMIAILYSAFQNMRSYHRPSRRI